MKCQVKLRSLNSKTERISIYFRSYGQLVIPSLKKKEQTPSSIKRLNNFQMPNIGESTEDKIKEVERKIKVTAL